MKIATNKSAVSFLKSMTTRRLLPSDVVFSHISFVGEHQIAFRMEPIRQGQTLHTLHAGADRDRGGTGVPLRVYADA